MGEIAIEIYRGNGITKSQVGSGKCPCILYGEIHTKHNIWFNKCSSLIDEKLIKRPKYCEYGDLIIAITSENLKDIGKTCAYLGQEKIIVGGDIVILKHKQNSKYLAYVLESYIGQKQKINLAQGMTVFHISTIAIKKLKIPLPPLEIQEQIANALDHLREICEDLEKGIPKEIELANKRYEYYRDLLITGEN
ncbi:putative type-1 restriction enzyme specificity protein MPN_089 [Candidatus Mycoplasma haematohominis]|uniref:Putative type-1 restriction enzyme specificity protein MPN_089 n=1 Tax=Candidatus Mycoplasma haematohominis TaxID=1494318 RepID=A0A478FUR8_9MOLU|nr:putative type-1 restriction enzyme specificity protein MPN_089 [Candidatus Mycoplasma haemohominis]